LASNSFHREGQQNVERQKHSALEINFKRLIQVSSAKIFELDFKWRLTFPIAVSL